MSDINFIEYDKISILSDAFITSDELNSYFQYIPSTKAISYNIKKEQHTAGTTEDPDDYKVPDVTEKISPRRLFRINPFHTNYSEKLELNKTNIDPDILYPTTIKEVKTKEVDYSSLGLNQDQIDFMMALQNLKSLKNEDHLSKLDIEEFSPNSEKVLLGFFQLYPRFMESIVSGVPSGSFSQFYDEVEPENDSSLEPLLNENLKRLGFDPKDVKVKKNFEIRSGNTKNNSEINNYLQSTLSTETKQNKIESSNNYNILNFSNQNRIQNFVKTSSSISNIENSLETNFSFTTNNQRTINQQNQTINKFSKDTKTNFDEIYKQFLKNLNIAPNVENQYTKTINQYSKNINFDFQRVLNFSENQIFETNLRNLSTAYNFYRYVENRYREFIQNLNFFNETIQDIKQTEVNLKNTYQNIHRHSFVQKNNHYKNIVNLTKNVNYEYTANDYEFQYAVLKTIKNSNQFVENKISKIKNDLNLAHMNISFLNHKMITVQEKTSNYINKEIKNVLNNTEYVDDYSNIIINKISNISNNQAIKSLLSLVSNEEQLNNVYRILRQSNINTDNIKNLVEVLNFSKNNNINITKVSKDSIHNIKEIINNSNQIENLDYQTINLLTSKNVSENLRTFVNLSQNVSLNTIASSFKNIDNITENLNLLSYAPKFSSSFINQKNIHSINLDKNIFTNQNIKKIEQLSNVVSNNYNIEKLSTVNIEDVSQKIQWLKQINFTKEDITKKINYINKSKKISRLYNTQEVQENIDYTDNTNVSVSEFNNEIRNIKSLVSLSKVNQITKNDIKKINNLKLSSVNEIAQNITTIERINEITNILESKNISELKSISELKNLSELKNISEIKNILNSRTINVLNNLAEINQNTIQSITQNSIQSINKISKISNFENIAEIINLTKDFKNVEIKKSNIENLTKNIEVVQKVSKIDNQDILNLINVQKIIKNRSFVNRISNVIQKTEMLDNVNISNETTQNLVKISNNQNIDQLFKQISLSNKLTSNNIQQINKLSNVQNVENVLRNINLIQKFTDQNIISKVSKIENKDLVSIVNLSKVYNENIKIFENKISNYSQRQKIRETLQDINLINNVENKNIFQVNNKTQKVQVQEFIENLNLLQTEKNVQILNRYSFESNKKNISNLFSELNVTQQMKQEKRTDKEFVRISKRIDRLSRETIKVEGNSYKVEQNFFDMMNFYNEQKVAKTSRERKVTNFFQLLDSLNIQKTNNERIINQKVQKIEQTSNRIVNNSTQIKFDVYKEKKDNYYKVENFQTFTSNNYHQEKEEKQKTEKIVENKVEELLVKKIENVTNNLVSNVITKNEFNTIKKEIIQEIFNIELKTEQRINEIRKETKQTVQTMLERFLRS